MIDLIRDGDICIVSMCNGPNLIDAKWQLRMLEVLDAVEAESAGNAGLVLTGEGKFFSNGLDVETLMGLEGDEMADFGHTLQQIMGRLITAPVPTVAAVNGHAFAAGAILALACDYRLMREDRGWICMPEVDIGVPISAPIMGILREKLPPATARDAVLTGRRYSADDAIAAGMADGKAPEADLVDAAKRLAGTLATKQRPIFKMLKQTLYAEVGSSLEAV